MVDSSRRTFLILGVATSTTLATPRSLWADNSVSIEAETSRWKIGFRLRTPVSFTSGLATFPVPMDWPEQTVTVVGRDVDPRVAQIQTRDVGGTARQVVVTMPRVLAGAELDVSCEVSIEKRRLVAPDDPASWSIPTRINRDQRIFMGNSPMIDASNTHIRQLSQELAAASPPNDWAKVRAIYDAVRERVRYLEGPIRNASEALREGQGDCEDMTSLFVALCRNARVPARMVWIPGHCYPEFYLEQPGSRNVQPVGRWFPCQAAGDDQFGEMNEARPILQKGDRFKVPEARGPVRYLAEYFQCDPSGDQPPRIEFFREQVLGG